MTDLIQQLEAWAGKMTAFGDLTAEDMLDLLRPAIEALEWYSERGPCWSLHSHSMEPTFSSNEARHAIEALADLRAKLGEK